MRKMQVGIAIGAILGLLPGWWHGFSGWPAWAALPFLTMVGGMICFRAVSSDRRALVWLLLWVLPGALIGSRKDLKRSSV
jgi:ABC-type xylose transport system permease subunit